MRDQPTREPAEDFYGRLLARLGRADAVREEQLALKDMYLDRIYWSDVIWQEYLGSLPTS